MTVSEEELAAYADGELAGTEAQRVAAAIAAEPALAERLEAERRLRSLLKGHLEPVVSEPVPENLRLMIAAAEDAEADPTDAKVQEPARILDFAAARSRRDQKARTAPPRRLTLPRWWSTGAVIAASLVLGLFLGTRMADDGAGVTPSGALMATGMLAKGLDEKLASSNEPGKLRILTSFRRNDGSYCRVYDAGASSGIACKDSQGWILQRAVTNAASQHQEYRQAGSAAAELMTAAQAMAQGDPLDAAQEREVRAAGWNK
ncbi:MAG: transcriptional regulator [Novosphingobium sp.]